MKSNIYITSFMDIGRSSWVACPRNIDQYFEEFRPYEELFRNNPEEKLICYMDSRYVDRVSKIKNIIVIPIDEEWCIKNIRSWSNIDIDEKCLKNMQVRNMFNERLKFADAYYAIYYTCTNAKVDFIHHTSNKYPEYTHYTWCDFGYFKVDQPKIIPQKLIDDKWLTNKVIIPILRVPDTNVKTHHIVYGPETYQGCVIIVPRSRLEEYRNLYHGVVDDFHREELSVPDQGIHVFCYYKNPKLFTLPIMKWCFGLKYFEKGSTMDRFSIENQ